MLHMIFSLFHYTTQSQESKQMWLSYYVEWWATSDPLLVYNRIINFMGPVIIS